MRFLIGLVIGLTLAAGTLSTPEGRGEWTAHIERWLARLPGGIANLPNDTAPATPAGMRNPGESGPPITQRTPEAAERAASEPSAPAASATDDSEEHRAFSGPPLFQVAWSPFRSETSARGFARKLEQQTTHAFDVVRIGPGHYEVGFEFESADERKKVLSAVEHYTGYVPDQPPRMSSL